MRRGIGVLSAVVLLIPYCLFSLKQLRDEQLITDKGIVKNLLLGIVILVPATFLALLIGKLIL